MEARRPEIEQALLTRIFAVENPVLPEEPGYEQGLRGSAAAAIDYALDSIERGGDRVGPAPPALLAQARLAGRLGIGLDTVLRRYLAGFTLLGDFFITEAQHVPRLNREGLQRAMRTQAAVFDRLIAAVSEEHARGQGERWIGSDGQRRREKVEQLLAGNLVDTSQINYDFAGHHLAMIVAGDADRRGLRSLARSLDCCTLAVERPDETVWAWLGAKRPLEPEEVLRHLDTRSLRVAIGEPAAGLAGWRLTHRQAMAAWPVIVRNPERTVARYSEVGLLAAVVRDELLVRTLLERCLQPLRQERDGGQTFRQTLRAYFATGRSVTSAAALLQVSRQTVRSRLRAVEAIIGRPLEDCHLELEIALQLEEAPAGATAPADRT